MNRFKPHFDEKQDIKGQIRVNTPKVPRQSSQTEPELKPEKVSVVVPTEQVVMQAKAAKQKTKETKKKQRKVKRVQKKTLGKAKGKRKSQKVKRTKLDVLDGL